MSDAARFDGGSEDEATARGVALVPVAAGEESLHADPGDRPPQASGSKRDWRRIGAAASLAAVALIGAAAAVTHIQALRTARGDEERTQALAQRLDAMSARLEAVEANRSRDDLVNLRKVLAEVKAGAATTREAAGAVGQLAARVDKLEKDQGARLDKLGDRIDHDAAGRLAEVTARLDRLEAKAAVAVAATPSPPLKPAGKTEAAKADPGVSNATTGAVEKPKPRLRGFYLADIRDGYAMIDSPEGEFSVAPGDVVPGGGRVLRIERRGRDWVVVTTQGTIAGD